MTTAIPTEKSATGEDDARTAVPEEPRVENFAPAEFSNYHYLKGEAMNLADGKGHKVFWLVFWGGWCPSCQTTLPYVQSVAEKKGADLKAVIVTREEERHVNEYLSEHNPELTVSVMLDKCLDQKRNYMGTVQQKHIPYSFIISKGGHCVWHGHPFEAELNEVLDREIAVPSEGGPEPEVVEDPKAKKKGKK